jgi:hypothetical protein
MSRFLLLTGMLALALLPGCGASEIDVEQRFDHTVEDSWTKDSNWVDAVKLLSTGGRFIDDEEDKTHVLDGPHVLPLLQRLSTEFGLEWQAITEDVNPMQALVVIARLPGDPQIRTKIEAVLNKEQDTFPGAILHQWGHRWLSINFLNKEQAAMIEQGFK